MVEHTVINVGGTSRAGSTMLHLILGSGPRAFACGEVVNLFRPIYRHHQRPRCACGRHPCPIWQSLEGTNAGSFYERAFSALDIDLLVDSSKEPSWLLDARRWTDRMPRVSAINIFSYKSVIDLAYSFWKRGHSLMYWRRQLLTYYGRIQHAGLPLLTVNLDELLADPRDKTRQVFDVLGLSYRVGQERFWENDHHHLFGNFGVRRQVQMGASTFGTARSYPAEFAHEERTLRAELERDVEVQDVLRALEAAEVKHAAPASGLNQRFERSQPYPAWYYRQRLKRLWRGRFPLSIDGDVRRSAATVPLEQDRDSR